ncbi:hypothetical protein LCGC14_1423130 [marine sediment metagenome]|uniref:DUF2326 domain-containing protein n=1 Tax=marine sediment metagenome TaxID=412755 RepID=A0A0F9JQK3_9ZZZZ
MKLSCIYSNRPEVFPRISFNDRLNVVYAKVTRPKESDKDSHNLGKTLLLHLIDFMLLKGLDKGHFLHKNKALFKDFVFLLEIQTNHGAYVTVRRDMEQSSKAWIKFHDSPGQDFSSLPDESWDYAKLPCERAKENAKEKLNTALGLTDVHPWDFRKALGYFLRAQGDYRDEFQLAKFAAGTHIHWKPFMAYLLGLDWHPIQKKYDLDEEISKKTTLRENSREIAGADVEAYDKLKGALAIKRAEADEARAGIERFNFYQQDMEFNAEVVERIENEIAARNDRLYTIDYEAQKLEAALGKGIAFDPDAVRLLFEEAQAEFPDALSRSYEELVDFNRKLSADRGRRLKEQLTSRREERKSVAESLRQLNQRREDVLDVIQDTDTLRKFRRLHHLLVDREAEIARLQTELEQLDKVAQIDKEIRELEHKRTEKIELISSVIRDGSDLYSDMRREFNRILKTIIGVPAILSTSMNKEGNVEFDAALLKSGTADITTSEGEGFSYRQLMCCAFDMAMLSAHANGSFYRFVYHDGVFEGLDNRKKLKLLEVMRDLTDRLGIQYILTVIDADMPRDDEDHVVAFSTNEVVRELFEGADEGRLFRMPKF